MNSVKIKVNGQEFDCPFGLEFIGELLDKYDMTVQEIGEKLDKNPFKWAPILMYESMSFKKELDFDKSELMKRLDNDGLDGMKTINTFIVAFVQSLVKDVPKSEQPKDDKPKKK